MIDPLALLGVGLSLGLLGAVLELVRRRRLAEELALVWLLLAGSLLVLSLRREVLHTLARWLGIAYPPALLLLASIVLGLLALLAFTVAISRQRDQIEKLIEEVALLGEAIRRLAAERSTNADDPKTEAGPKPR